MFLQSDQQLTLNTQEHEKVEQNNRVVQTSQSDFTDANGGAQVYYQIQITPLFNQTFRN